MYIANSLIEAGGARYKPGDIVPRLDDMERLIALGFVIVVAGSAEEYAEAEQEAAEAEQECPETVTEGFEQEQEAAETEQECPETASEGIETEQKCPGDEEPEETASEQVSVPPVIGRQSQQGKKFGRKK